MEDQLEERLAAVPQTLNAFYRFSRPHTMLGTFVSVVSVSTLAVVGAALPFMHALVLCMLWSMGVRVLWGMDRGA